MKILLTFLVCLILLQVFVWTTEAEDEIVTKPIECPKCDRKLCSGKCPTYPAATCVPNICKCTEHYELNGKKLGIKDCIGIIIPISEVPVQLCKVCSPLPCSEHKCPTYPNAVCVPDKCMCTEHYEIKGAVIKPGVCSGTPKPMPEVCLKCPRKPCSLHNCPAHPKATCVPNNCKCTEHYELNGKTLHVKECLLKPICKIKCVRAPCSTHLCPNYPRSRCVPSKCGCGEEYYLKSQKIPKEKCYPKSKVGVCPGPKPAVMCPMPAEHLCLSNNDCKDRNTHCCNFACANKCVKYLTDPRCPKAPAKPPVCRPCRDCSKKEICCNVPGCDGGMACVKPTSLPQCKPCKFKGCPPCKRFPNAKCILDKCGCFLYYLLPNMQKIKLEECQVAEKCPAPTSGGVGCSSFEPNDCFKDKDCKKGQNCCFNSCKNVCQDRVLSSPKCRPCKVKGCPPCKRFPGAKCILDKCGCFLYYLLKNGMKIKLEQCHAAPACPNLLAGPMPKCIFGSPHECVRDKDCKRSETCCYNGCINICTVVPVEDKECKKLPRPKDVSPISAVKCMQSCKQPGNHCPPGQFCCLRGACGLVCVPKPIKPIKCPRGLPPVECKVNPCLKATCPRHPTAECRPNYCGGCNAEFFINNKKVDCRNDVCPYNGVSIACAVDKRSCKTDVDCPNGKVCCQIGCQRQCIVPLPPKKSCDGLIPIVCIQDPCVRATCPAHKGAMCRSYCGCHVAWFVNGREVNCKPTEKPMICPKRPKISKKECSQAETCKDSSSCTVKPSVCCYSKTCRKKICRPTGGKG